MIPFLNGGLFQPIVEEYDMDQVAFEIPNELFSNDNLTKEGDKGDGILDIFDRYAFTVKEDEPLEKEVAVDPEMLGKVFEGIKLFNDALLEQYSEIAATKEQDIEQMDIFTPQSQNILDEIYTLQEKVFATSDTKQKMDLKKQIDKYEWDLIEKSLIENGKSRELPKIRELKRLNSKPYFLWKLNFAKVCRDKGGFDIVIGNPPYVDSELMTKTIPELREIYSTIFESAKGNWDLFVIFIEKGVNLLKQNGYISFIVPNKLVSAKYTEALRNILLSWNIKELRDYSKIRVFKEADVYPVVFLIGKNLVKQKVKMIVMESILQPGLVNEIDHEIFYSDIYWDKYFSTELRGIDIIQKLFKFPKLEQYATVLGAATVSEAYEFKEFVWEYKDNVSNAPYKKFINSGTIDRYLSLWGQKKMTYIKSSYNEPILLDKDIRSISQTRLNQARSEKIIIAGMTKRLECIYDTGDYLAAKSTVIILKKNVDLQYLIGLLNSKLITFFFNNFFSSLSLAGGYLRVGPPQIKQIPIAIPSEALQTEIINHVKIISSVTRDQKYCNDSEKQDYVASIELNIDNLVYRAYELTSEEIKIIDNFCY